MAQVYRVAIADDDRHVLHILRHCLGKAGHEVVIEATSGEALIERCVEAAPDLIIIDINMPGLGGLSAVQIIQEKLETPVIVLSSHCTEQLIERANMPNVFSYLVKPFQIENLLAAVSLTVQRFKEMQSYRQEVSTVRQTLKDRKIVERAKGLVMSRLSIDEQTAFQHLRKLARDHRKALVDIANSILLTEQAMTIGG
jgi:AmiR/NasT family two-component response regulator